MCRRACLRGHSEEIQVEANANKGDFLELVQLIGKFDPMLREHLVKVKIANNFTTSYLSPKIQNEFVDILEDHVRNKVVGQVKQSDSTYSLHFSCRSIEPGATLC